VDGQPTKEIREKGHRREAAEQYLRLAETSPYGIVEIDTKGNIFFANSAYHRMLNYPENSLMGTNIRELIPQGNRDRIMTKIANLITEEPSPKPNRSQNITKNGRVIDLELAWHYKRKQNNEIIGFVSVITDITERIRVEERSREKSSKLETLTAELRKLALQSANKEEVSRRRFATILHEQVGQNLAAIRMKLPDLLNGTPSEPNKVKEVVDRLVFLLDDAIMSTRELTSALYPTILDDLGLLPAITWYKDLTLRKKGLNVSLQIDPSVESLIPESKISLFRIIQETFLNIAKHASATEVRVEITSVNQTMKLTIQDNGVGFPGQPSKRNGNNGIGLLLMKERSLSLGGGLEVQSAVGEGTTLIVKIPLKLNTHLDSHPVECLDM
jgi:two-component system sensor histidine kinase UhpB